MKTQICICEPYVKKVIAYDPTTTNLKLNV